MEQKMNKTSEERMDRFDTKNPMTHTSILPLRRLH